MGLVRRAGPRLDAQLHDLRPARDWSDSWYCNKQYDKLYQQQHVETDQTKREAEIKQMQEILYQDSPYLVTAYYSIGEAVPQRPVRLLRAAAQPGRHLARAVRRLQLHPRQARVGGRHLRPATTSAGDTLTGAVQATSGGDSSSSAGTGVLIGAGVVVLVLVVGGGVFAVAPPRHRGGPGVTRVPRRETA